MPYCLGMIVVTVVIVVSLRVRDSKIVATAEAVAVIVTGLRGNRGMAIQPGFLYVVMATPGVFAARFYAIVEASALYFAEFIWGRVPAATILIVGAALILDWGAR